MKFRNIFKKKTSSEETNEWPFDQGPNVAAITSTHITKEGKPILVVTHYEDDDSWGFQSGLDVSLDDSQVVSMKTILDTDPSLKEIADLPSGWSAERERIGGEWKKYKDEFEDE